MVECVLDKQRTDVEVGGAVVEVVDEIDWNFGQMYVSNKKNFVMRLGSCVPMCHREELCS